MKTLIEKLKINKHIFYCIEDSVLVSIPGKYGWFMLHKPCLAMHSIVLAHLYFIYFNRIQLKKL